MKGFIKVSQTNNAGNYVNVTHIVRFYIKSQNSTAIVLSDGSEIECKQSFEDLEKLVYNALVL